MIIGMHGQARVGKDTAYQILETELHDVPVFHKSFAYKLKSSAAAALGVTDDPITFCDRLKEDGVVSFRIDTDPYAQTHDITGREYLQKFGTEAHRRIFDTNFWVDQCLPVDYPYDSDSLTVVTDVRFENEAERIHDLGGQVWHIRRPDVETDDAHASEQVLPSEMLDVVIWNDGTLDEYADKVITTFEMMVQVWLREQAHDVH